MADIYAIGDVQGCFDTLQALLATLPLRKSDRLWFCGDLVNRGPKSLEVLRWVMSQGDRVQVVLGNHDLHLLAAASGNRKQKSRDTLEAVLDADDCEKLLDWLRMQPLAHREEGHLMVHAGVHPRWSAKQVVSVAKECERALQEGTWFSAWKRSRPLPPPWSDSLAGKDRIAAALSILVGIRTIARNGQLDTQFTGHPSQRPDGVEPWFARTKCKSTVVFGHWAALGLHIDDNHLGLDTGCVWGGSLTAIRLRDRKVFQQPALEVRRPMG